MTTSHHARTPLARTALAAGGVACALALCGAADVTARHLGATAGAALISAVVAACWAAHRLRQFLRPARPARDCIPVAPAEVRPPAQIAA